MSSLPGDDDLPDLIFPSPLRASAALPKGVNYIPGSIFSVKPKLEELGAGVGKVFTVGISQSEETREIRDQGVQSPTAALTMDSMPPTILLPMTESHEIENQSLLRSSRTQPLEGDEEVSHDIDEEPENELDDRGRDEESQERTIEGKADDVDMHEDEQSLEGTLEVISHHSDNPATDDVGAVNRNTVDRIDQSATATLVISGEPMADEKVRKASRKKRMMKRRKSQRSVEPRPATPSSDSEKSHDEHVGVKFIESNPFMKNREEFKSQRTKLNWDALKMTDSTRVLDSTLARMTLDDPLEGDDKGRARLELSILQDRMDRLRDTVRSPEQAFSTAQRTIEKISKSLEAEKMSAALMREEIQRLHATIDDLRKAKDNETSIDIVRAKLDESERLLDFADHWKQRQLLLASRPFSDPGESLRQLITDLQTTGQKTVFKPSLPIMVSYCVAEIRGEPASPSRSTQAGQDPNLFGRKSPKDADWKARLRTSQDEQWKRMIAGSRAPY